MRKKLYESIEEAQAVFADIKFIQEPLQNFKSEFEKTGLNLVLFWGLTAKHNGVSYLQEVLTNRAIETYSSATPQSIESIVYGQIKEMNRLFRDVVKFIPDSWRSSHVRLQDITCSDDEFFISDDSKEEIMDRTFRIYSNSDLEEKALNAAIELASGYQAFKDVLKTELRMATPFGELNILHYLKERNGRKVVDTDQVVKVVRRLQSDLK
ncbi:hypothetical protein [Flavobacterium selenitireducens]|uniref:hypothetical protein n=1 Tax=Flavobacterium selenitireducens TaxID=2722704 RepID=UPI00168A5C04|nr:hypothetical protein [Flavobacterium selenitireducens]MBD3582750.1 hypothetical protein [Flavobacterium selenitireducens]